MMFEMHDTNPHKKVNVVRVHETRVTFVKRFANTPVRIFLVFIVCKLCSILISGSKMSVLAPAIKSE